MSTLIIDEYPKELFETNIFKTYSANDFNNKLHINDTIKINMDDAALAIGELLKKHNLLDLLGVCKIHNHFQLTDDEIVLAKTNENNSLKYLHLKATSFNSNSGNVVKPIPYMWAYDKKTRSFFSLQFFDGIINNEMENRFQKLASRSDDLVNFYNEFIVLAENFGLEDVLGINLLYNDLITELKNDEEFIEVTNFENREQWISATKKDDERSSVITHWNFCVDDGIVKFSRCYSQCVVDKNGHYTANHFNVD